MIIANTNLVMASDHRWEEKDSRTETENTTFQATGIVKTADGKEIPLTLDVRMARSFTSGTSVSLRR